MPLLLSPIMLLPLLFFMPLLLVLALEYYSVAGVGNGASTASGSITRFGTAGATVFAADSGSTYTAAWDTVDISIYLPLPVAVLGQMRLLLGDLEHLDLLLPFPILLKLPLRLGFKLMLSLLLNLLRLVLDRFMLVDHLSPVGLQQYMLHLLLLKDMKLLQGLTFARDLFYKWIWDWDILLLQVLGLNNIQNH